MDLQLRGMKALVTGGSKGIGLACATQLAIEGCQVELVSRSESSLDRAADILEQATGERPHIHAFDLADGDALQGFAPRIRECDILINNAGLSLAADSTAVDATAWRRAWDLKVFGYIEATRIAIDAMTLRKRGASVNVIGMGRPASLRLSLRLDRQRGARQLHEGGGRIRVSARRACRRLESGANRDEAPRGALRGEGEGGFRRCWTLARTDCRCALRSASGGGGYRQDRRILGVTPRDLLEWYGDRRRWRGCLPLAMRRILAS